MWIGISFGSSMHIIIGMIIAIYLREDRDAEYVNADQANSTPHR